MQLCKRYILLKNSPVSACKPDWLLFIVRLHLPPKPPMTTATDMLAKYLEAEIAVLAGKDVSFGDRRLSMANLPEIIAGRKEWEQRVAAESAKTHKAPSIGGLNMSVASFNRGATSRFNRNG